jgi:iron complex outermembrane receptor protein
MAGLVGIPAQAQTLPPLPGAGGAVAAEDARTRSGGIEEVTVTAQRRAESVQSVPISISTVSTGQMEQAVLLRTDDLMQVVPGLVVTRQLSGGTIYIRGVGSQSIQPGVESPVATYVDGVYYPTATGSIFSFNNVRQVEVLRGPQGTLFGRNATGGLISIKTLMPSAEESMVGSIGYGDYETVTGDLYLNGGSDTLAGDVAMYGTYQGEGFGQNLVTGEDVNYIREVAVRSKVLWSPTQEDRFIFGADWSRDETDLGVVRPVYPGGVLIDGSTYVGQPYDSRSNYPEEVKVDHWGLSLTYERDFGSMKFTSLSAYRDLVYSFSLDQDSTPVPLVNVNAEEDSHSFQQELILVGETPRFTWTAGVFLFFAENSYNPLAVRSPIVPPLNFNTVTQQDTQSYAVFTQETFHLGDNTNLTAGLRYTSDERRITGSQVSSATGATLATANDESTFPETTWRLALDHKLTEDVLFYVSYNRGFKSGVYATGSVANRPVEPEVLDAFETGLKSDLFDDVLRLNVAAFYYDYQDIQLNRIEQGAGILLNAAEGEAYGGEVEATFAPRLESAMLEINANLSLLHTEYTSFPDGPTFTPNPGGGNIPGVADLSGNEMIRSPGFTFNFGVAYSAPVGKGSIELSANYYRSDDFKWEPDGRLTQPAYDVVNAQIGYAFGHDQRYRFRLWGKNLTDSLYYTYAIESVLGDSGGAAPPRTYGLAFDWEL